VDVAVLEVRRDYARQLGLAVGPGLNISVPFTPGGNSAAGATLPLDRLDEVDTGDWSITLPGAQLNALLTDATTKILQRPQIRASDGMKATLRIGDKVPIATGAYQPGVAGQAVSALVQTQFQYQDVGVNVDITPKVHANREITLKVRVEVSAVTSQAEPVPGVKQPVIGQRVIEHDIRLREGEVNVLGGILQTADGESVSGIPGLSQIPILRYLFSNVSKTISEDEVLIVLKPHTVRVQDLTPLNLRAIDIGTEGDVRLRRPSELPEPAPAPETPAAPPIGAPSAPMPATPQGAGSQPGTASIPMAAARFQFPDSEVNRSAGETFDVAIRLENGRDIFEVPFELRFDTAALKLIGVRKGDFWPDGQPVAIVERDMASDGGAGASVSMTRPPGSSGVSGAGTLAVLTFQALRAGSTALGILPAGVRTSANHFVPVQGAQADVTIR
jgi:general secretion pathway protein D